MGQTRALFNGFVIVFLIALPIAIYGCEYVDDSGDTGVGDNATGCIATGCDRGTTAGAGTESVRIVASGGQFYRPGRNQQIQVIIDDAIAEKYGFQLTARVSSNPHSTQGALLSPVGSGSRHVQCGDGSKALPNGGSASMAHSLDWVENTAAGYNKSKCTPGTYTYTFSWIPPPANVGPVIFYAAANVTTGLLVGSGTHTYLSSLTLSPANSTPTSVGLSSSNNASTLGQNVTLTASVLPAGTTGTVTFYDGANVIGSSKLSGQAVLTTNLLPAGRHSIWAYYSGDSNYLESKSAAITETVTPLPVRSFTADLNYTPDSVVPSSVTVADFNGDGITDIAIANYAGNDTVVLLGNGNGSFSFSFRYVFSVGQQPQGIAVGDFNMDGRPDLAVANTGSGDISVLLGNGDGTFQLAVNYASGNSLPCAPAIGDFNNDGIPDLAVATANGGKISILSGNGDGTFKPAKVFSVGLSGNPKSLLVLDLNNDGKADLAAIGPSGAVIVLIGSGDGTFQTSAQSVTGVALAVTAGDFNLDGKPDLAVGTTSGLFVLLGNGDGSLQPPIPVTVSDSAWDLAVGDFNGDGFPDLVEVNGGTNLHLFPGNGDGSFQAPTAYNTGIPPQQVSVADFNRDGRPDLAIIVGPSFPGLHVALGLLEGPPSKLVFSTQPSNGTVGMPIAPVVIQIQDQYGDLVTHVDEGLTVTSSPSGILTGVNTQNGVATLDSLVFSAPGTYTLTASAPGLTPATSNSFTLTTATALPNVVIDSPTSGTVISSGTVVLTGWALDNIGAIGTAVTSVQVKVDGVFIGNAAYGTSRPDVCGAYSGRPGCPNVGFTYSVSLALLNPGSHTITVLATDSDASPNVGSASVNITVARLVMASTKVGVFRADSQFLEDVNGNGSVDGPDRFLTTFAPPGGLQAGDLAVVGDWTGDGHAKAGYYRPSAGTWWLDANNDGSFGAGDFTYEFGGLSGDIPVVGDWNGVAGVSTHKICIGIYRTQGSVWLLDLNCNGSFENTPTDAFFPFGGLAGDVPVVGNFTGSTTRVGVVRKYAPAGVPQGEPFFWVYDAGNANAGTSPANHPPAAASAFPFGGLPGDQFVVGDWLDTGTARAGVYRGGLWVLDSNGLHNPDLILSYGGLPSDKAVTGKW